MTGGREDGRMSGETTDQTRAAYDAVAESYAEMIPDTRYEASVDLAMVRHFVESIAVRPEESTPIAA